MTQCSWKHFVDCQMLYQSALIMVLIVIVIVIAGRLWVGICFCSGLLPWQVMGGPTPSPSARWLLSICAVRSGPASSLSWSAAAPLYWDLLVQAAAWVTSERWPSDQNPQWTELGINFTLYLGPWVWRYVPHPSLQPLLEPSSPLSPHLGHTAIKKVPEKGT